LAEDIAKYLYLPRLCDENVLLEAIREGVARLTWESETFAYADGWDEKKYRYKGLRVGNIVRVLIDSESLLVKSDVAARQLEAEQVKQTAIGTQGALVNGGGLTGVTDSQVGVGASTAEADAEVVLELPKPKRFYGSVKLDSVRLGRDASKIAEEIVQHLTSIVGVKWK